MGRQEGAQRSMVWSIRTSAEANRAQFSRVFVTGLATVQPLWKDDDLDGNKVTTEMSLEEFKMRDVLDKITLGVLKSLGKEGERRMKCALTNFCNAYLAN